MSERPKTFLDLLDHLGQQAGSVLEVLVSHDDQQGAAPIVHVKGPLESPPQMGQEHRDGEPAGVAVFTVAEADIYIASQDVASIAATAFGWQIALTSGVLVNVRDRTT